MVGATTRARAGLALGPVRATRRQRQPSQPAPSSASSPLGLVSAFLGHAYGFLRTSTRKITPNQDRKDLWVLWNGVPPVNDADASDTRTRLSAAPRCTKPSSSRSTANRPRPDAANSAVALRNATSSRTGAGSRGSRWRRNRHREGQPSSLCPALRRAPQVTLWHRCESRAKAPLARVLAESDSLLNGRTYIISRRSLYQNTK